MIKQKLTHSLFVNDIHLNRITTNSQVDVEYPVISTDRVEIWRAGSRVGTELLGQGKVVHGLGSLGAVRGEIGTGHITTGVLIILCASAGVHGF